MRALVTGGAGFIGSHLVETLARRARVTVLDDLSVGRREHVRGRLIVGDVRDRRAVDRAVRGHAIVYHLAVQCLRVSLRDPSLVHEVNATGSLNVALACLRHGAKMVYCSSSEVYGTAVRPTMGETHPTEPTTVYGASKLAGEQYVLSLGRSHGLRAVVVRPFNTYGPREHFEGAYGEVIPKFVLRAMNGRAPVIFGDGGQSRDFNYVEDTARGIVLAGACRALEGRAVNIGSGRETTIAQLASKVLAAVGRRDLRPERAPARPGDVRRHRADTSLARRALGFAPRVGLEEGLRRYVDWVRCTLDVKAAVKREGRWARGVPS